MKISKGSIGYLKNVQHKWNTMMRRIKGSFNLESENEKHTLNRVLLN